MAGSKSIVTLLFLLKCIVMVPISTEVKVSIQPRNLIAETDEEVTFSCSADGGPNNVFRWTRTNNVDLESVSGSGDVFNMSLFLENIEVVQSGPVLNISSVNATQDGGQYYCIAVNEAGYDSATATLNVAPFILEDPQSQLALPGDNVPLSCLAESFPTPMYRWEKLNTDTDMFEVVSNSNTRELILISVEHNDFGDYHCVATAPGIDEETTSDIATVTVSPTGSISVSPDEFNVTSNDSNNVLFNCSAQGGPNNMFQWVFKRTNEVVSNNSQLILTTVAMNGGVYRCVVSNAAGNDTATVTLNVSPLTFVADTTAVIIVGASLLVVLIVTNIILISVIVHKKYRSQDKKPVETVQMNALHEIPQGQTQATVFDMNECPAYESTTMAPPTIDQERAPKVEESEYEVVDIQL